MGKRSNHKNKAQRQEKQQSEQLAGVGKLVQSFVDAWKSLVSTDEQDAFLGWIDWLDNQAIPGMKKEEDKDGAGLVVSVAPVGKIIAIGHYTQFYQAVRGFRSYLTSTGQGDVIEVDIAA